MARQTKYHELLLKNYKKLANYSKALYSHYNAFFLGFQYPVFATNEKGCFVFFNRSAEKFTGYSKKEVMGRHFRMLFTLDDLGDGFLFFYQAMRGCYSENTRFRIRLKDGSTRIIDVLAAPVSFDSKIQGVLAIAKDVSGQISNAKSDQKRVVTFKKFSQDLDAWDQKHQMVKQELQNILSKLNTPRTSPQKNNSM